MSEETAHGAVRFAVVILLMSLALLCAGLSVYTVVKLFV